MCAPASHAPATPAEIRSCTRSAALLLAALGRLARRLVLQPVLLLALAASRGGETERWGQRAIKTQPRAAGVKHAPGPTCNTAPVTHLPCDLAHSHQLLPCCWLRWASLHAALCSGQCFVWQSQLQGGGEAEGWGQHAIKAQPRAVSTNKHYGRTCSTAPACTRSTCAESWCDSCSHCM